ncbi:hypothetical protein [Aliarcobacter vitoriensis]|uniref:Uncharacterized protein n=1 Tax=Aliarcobacter vitoriensis TaxID=2011099 RepID=A0A366MVQ6_9BACT|nr:hypothetical protein [Aliarcobacter vitoriensis]RBQ29472.1 hypothetical protein CRU91_03840 [Aliarcobacter vitoriensis]
MNSTKIIKLGEKIVDELLLSDGVDTLSKWMAHYIAELIEKAKYAEGEEKEKYEKECFETILKLWGEMYKVPNAKAPLSRFEKIYELCDEMMSKDKYRYFHAKHEDDSNEFLVLAKVVDKLSKKIVQNAFFLAYQDAVKEEKEWLEFDIVADIQELRQIDNLFKDNCDIDQKEKEEWISTINKLLEIID